MAISDHSDYYQYSWESLVKSQDSVPAKSSKILMFAVVVAVIASIVLGVILFMDLSSQEIFWLIICGLILLVFLSVSFWYQFGLSGEKPRIHSYKINKEGLWIDRRQVKFSELNQSKVIALISATELNTEPMLRMKLPLKSYGSVLVHFDDEATYRRFISGMKHYLEDSAG